MELLLNLAWLLLAVPAYYIWRSCRQGRAATQMSSAQCILALGCALVVLFPVVSATDDLHVVRAEMEESRGNKRSICQKGSDRPSAWKWHVQPSIASISFPIFADFRTWTDLPDFRIQIESPQGIQPTGRAPPYFSLG